MIDEGGNIYVDAAASDCSVHLEQHGPYNTTLKYYTAIAEQHLDLIADGQIHVGYPKEAFLFYRFLRDTAAPKTSTRETSTKFFLKHVDDKGDHIMVDEEYNITGIVDWQFVRIVPSTEAFGPSLVTTDLRRLYSQNTGLSEEDLFLQQEFQAKNNADLTGAFAGDDLAMRFVFGLSSELYRHEVVGMTEAVLTACGKTVNNMEEWIVKE
jgi:hypothetical protein